MPAIPRNSIFGVLLLVTSLAARATDDVPVQTLWLTNGSVNAVVETGGNVYVGGNFTAVGPFTGNAVAVSPSFGTIISGFPKVNGAVNAIVPDGSGGYYIGGSFTSVGSFARNRVAHIERNKSVDPLFNPNSNGTVNALALSGNTLFAGGSFSSIGGQDRSFIAALDTATGLSTGFNPDANGSVNALLVTGGTVIAGGSFTRIDGKVRNRIAQLNVFSGAATTFNPDANDTVSALLLSGGTLFAGGTFTAIGDRTRRGIAALDISSGFANNFNPGVTSGGTAQVLTLALNGTTLYYGGSFTATGGLTRNNIAAADTLTGSITSFNPNASSSVRSLALQGTTIFVGGDFTTIGGQTRNFIASLDAAGAAIAAFNPSANSSVSALDVTGTTLFTGGFFTSMNSVPRRNLAAFTLSDGSPTAWDPNPDGIVNAMLVSGASILAGGQFANVGGQARARIASLNATTGVAAAGFNPGASGGNVSALALSGTSLFVGGTFTTLGGSARNFIGAVDVNNGVLSATFNPNPSSTIAALATIGTSVYAGGFFNTIGGQTRPGLAALDATTGAALVAFNANTTGQVLTMATTGSALFVGGTFSAIGGQTRNNLAALNPVDGSANGFDPSPNAGVTALALNGTSVYAAGNFTSIGGQARARMAELRSTTGIALPFSPEPNGGSNVIVVGANTVYAGGFFSFIGGESRPGFAGFSLANKAPTLTSADPSELIANGPSVTVTLFGTGFSSSSVARWNGGDRETSFTPLRPLQLSVGIPASDLKAIGANTVTVFNPAPGGGTSNALTINVSDEIIVTTTDDSFAIGTLRRALTIAQPGSKIIFDAGVFAASQLDLDTTIFLESELPALDKGVTIDAQDRRVTIKGSATPAGSFGLRIVSDGNTIRGLTIKDFPRSGILIDGTVSAKNNVLGGNRTTGAGPNGQGLRISGNDAAGIEIKNANADSNTIKGCWIGLDSSGISPESNFEGGIVLSGGASGNQIGGPGGERNVISGNLNAGIAISGLGTDSNVIQNNFIGVVANFDPSVLEGSISAANSIAGVIVQSGALSNLIGGEAATGNVIAFNSGPGVLVRGLAAQNRIQANSIFGNASSAILLDSGNNNVAAPSITAIEALGPAGAPAGAIHARITGTAAGDGTVEVFNDSQLQARIFLGRAIVASGAFSLEADIDPALNVSATFTDTAGNTSGFRRITADTDSDGFPDTIETLLGSDPASAASTPTGSAANIQPLTILKTAVKLSFAKPGTDSFSVSGTLPLADGTVVSGNVAYDFGGFAKELPAVGAELKIAKPKGGVAKFTLKGSKLSLASKLSDEGLTPTGSGTKTIKVFLFVNGVLYSKNQTVAYVGKTAAGAAK